MTDCEIILVGDELLKGERHDAHLPWLARVLAGVGVRVARAYTIRDDADEIRGLIAQRLGETRLLVITGGLGPTPDDVTREAFAAGFARELEFHNPSWQAIVARFESYGRPVTDANRRQAMVPTGGEVIPNAHGTAPGCFLDGGDTLGVLLPGPPRELRPMVERDVLPRVATLFHREPLRVETFRTIGVGESDLMTQFGDALGRLDAWRVSSLPSLTGVDIILTARDGADRGALDEGANRMEGQLRAGLGGKFYEHGIRSLDRVVHDTLSERGDTLAVAESLTGGRIGAMLTDHAGSSAYLLADVVTYSNESKVKMLGVQPEIISEHGAVSEETCTAMAHGVRRATGATWALTTTGIAGPSGGSEKKPVGLVYLGVAWDGGVQAHRVRYRGSRDMVRTRAVYGALWILLDRLHRA